jgi:hypothetical protein
MVRLLAGSVHTSSNELGDLVLDLELRLVLGGGGLLGTGSSITLSLLELRVSLLAGLEVLEGDTGEGLEGLGGLLDELLEGLLIDLDLLVGTAPGLGPAKILSLLLVDPVSTGLVIKEDEEL